MRNYFNLNQRVLRAKKDSHQPLLNKDNEDDKHNSPPKEPVLSVAYQVVMYLGTFLGVFLSTTITHFRLDNIHISVTIGEIVLSAVIALVIIPIVYEKLQMTPQIPLVVQFGLFVQNGVFWHVLIDSMGSVL